MTERLEQAIAEVRKLPPEKQDSIAEIIFQELEGDQPWEELFADPRSYKLLEEMASEALKEHRIGNQR